MKQAEILYKILSESPVAMTAKEISEASNIEVPNLSFNFTLMRRGIPNFYQERRNNVVYYTVGTEKLSKIPDKLLPSQYSLPKDLWRGWVCPRTKIVPERLGL